MAMFGKIGRLFQIKTRLEAWLVIYAIALGAVERGRLYLDTYPGLGGSLLALACTGVVSSPVPSCWIRETRPVPAMGWNEYGAAPPSAFIDRSRPTHLQRRRGSESRISRHRD
jgi:hypothetical protein